MPNNTIQIYDKEKFGAYKSKRKNEGVPIYTFAAIDTEYDFTYLKTEIDLDLSSAIDLIKNENLQIKYAIEKLLYNIAPNEEINYLIEKRYEYDIFKELGSFFSNKKYITDFKDENREEKTNNDNDELSKLTTINGQKLNALFRKINNNLIGHKGFKDNLKNEINMFRYFNNKLGDLPILSVFLLGPSGVGKTEVARIIHKYLDTNNPLAKINFANYKNESSLASLIGSPPGYKDSEGPSDLVQKINRSKSGVLLVDEFEKADAAAHNFFLQLLEEGKFDDAMGNVYDLNGYIIIFTSNLNKENYHKEIPPELRSRFNVVSNFSHLTKEEKYHFAYNMFLSYKKKSRVRMNEETIKKLLNNIDLLNEKNLRNIQKEVRRSFYEFVKK